jgi:transposase
MGSILPDLSFEGVPIMSPYSLFVGVDIAAQSAMIEWQHPDTEVVEQMNIEQTRRDFKRLTQRLRQLAQPEQTLMVIEATGTYWMALALFLHQAGFVVSVINPAQGRHFARMHLRRTKTDGTDAQLLAQFARMIQPTPWTPPPAICEQLHQRLAQREDFLHMRTQERNRLHALRHHPNADQTLIRRLKRHIGYLEGEIDALQAEIEALLLGDHEWRDAARRLLTIKGVGIITASWILVATHQFARCHTPEQAASFAGLAPHAQDSGTSRRGKRSVGGGGHAALRKALYRAAGSAIRFNPPVQQFYDRLVRQGKLKKVARCAAARKLLHIAWAVVVKERNFDPHYQSISALQPFAA